MIQPMRHRELLPHHPSQFLLSHSPHRGGRDWRLQSLAYRTENPLIFREYVRANVLINYPDRINSSNVSIIKSLAF